MQQDMSRGSILEWANGLLRSNYQNFSQIPAKGIARIMNAMYGNERCPLHEVHFNDDSQMAVMWNTQKVLELARRCGFDGKLDAIRWMSNSDFAQELIFWRWLRTSSLSNPIPPGFDFSLDPVRPPLGSSHNLSEAPPAAKKLRTEVVAVTTTPGAASAAVQSHAIVAEAVAHLNMKEKELNYSFSGDIASSSCPLCPTHVNRITKYHVNCVKKLEAVRARVRQACEEKNLEMLLSALEEVV